MSKDKTNLDSVEVKNGGRIYTHQEISETKPIELKYGQTVRINGEDFVFEKDGFRNLPLTDDDRSVPHFYIYFRKGYEKALDKISGCNVVRRKGYVGIDIYPILKELFGNKVKNAYGDFCGVEVLGDGDNLGTFQLSFSPMIQSNIQRKLERMFDMSIVNQTQRRAFQSYIDSMFGDLWSDFISGI